MKICPKCTAVNEETKATKCAICGANIKDQIEYTKETLSDPTFSKKLKQSIERTTKKHSHMRYYIGVLELIVIIGVLFFGFRFIELGPRGYIEIAETEITMRVGEEYLIQPTYSNGVKARHVGIHSNDDFQSISIMQKQQGFIIHANEVDTLEVVFRVRANQAQQYHNQAVKIIILPPKGHITLEITTQTIHIGDTITIKPICSEYLHLSYVQYTLEPDFQTLEITVQPTGFVIKALDKGTYTITFYAEEPDEYQSLYPNVFTLIVVE